MKLEKIIKSCRIIQILTILLKKKKKKIRLKYIYKQKKYKITSLKISLIYTLKK